MGSPSHDGPASSACRECTPAAPLRSPRRTSQQQLHEETKKLSVNVIIQHRHAYCHRCSGKLQHIQHIQVDTHRQIVHDRAGTWPMIGQVCEFASQALGRGQSALLKKAKELQAVIVEWLLVTFFCQLYRAAVNTRAGIPESLSHVKPCPFAIAVCT